MEVDHVEFFRTGFQDEFLKALAKGMDRVYPAVHESCFKKYPKEQARNLLPFMRWVMVDTMLLRVARRRGLSAHSIKSDGGTFFVQVWGGQSILTASSVDGETTVPRRAVFRTTRARENGPWLFPEWEDKPPDDALLYGVLIHGPEEGNQKHLGFATIRFPLPDCSEWAPGKISLLHKFPPASYAKRTVAPVEEIEDRVLAQLREDAKAEAAKGKREKA